MPPIQCVAAAALLLAGLLVGCGDEEAAAPPTPPPPQVTVVTLQQQPVVLKRELPGRTSPYVVAEVRPQVTGIVEDRLFTEGGLVKAGEPLYQLDDELYRAELNNAKAAVSRTQATLAAARTTARRAVDLAKVNAVSKQDEDNALAALRQAEADVRAAEAAVQGNAVAVSHARITSPISGRIGKSTVTKGALVTANQAAPLATVQQLDPIYVDLTASSAELLRFRKDMMAGKLASTRELPVTVLLEDGSEYSHAGKLAFTEVTVDPTTGAFSMRVVVPNPDHLLLPGMYVRAVVSTGERQEALLVPQRGVTRDPKGNATAMVMTPDKRVEVRAVEVSRTVGDRWLVDGGLVAGDRVIVEGVQHVKPGMQVQVVEASTDAAPSGGGAPQTAAPSNGQAAATANPPAPER
ncbi:MAG TPA: efflux RND transporter periplasmic adaptor subunit [Burkholderiales bacterium]